MSTFILINLLYSLFIHDFLLLFTKDFNLKHYLKSDREIALLIIKFTNIIKLLL